MPEFMHERLYLKEPRTERLRKGAAVRLRQLISTGWRETERWHAADYVTLRLERGGSSRQDLPKPSPPRVRPTRQGPRQSQGRGRGGSR